MLIGEAPGRSEHIERKPFVGKSGQILDISLQLAGLSRLACYVTNAYKCWPGRDRYGNDLTPTERQVEDHAALLSVELKRVKPRVIGTVGRVATRLFIKDAVMESCHGIPHQVGEHVIVPIVHPAAGMRPGAELMAVWSFQDFKVLADVVKGKLKPRTSVASLPKSHWITGKGQSSRHFSNLAVDTEGDLRDPFCVSLAWTGQRGFVVRPEHVSNVKPTGELILHYALHDLPVLRRMGLDLSHVRISDTMVKAYVLGEPQSLKDLTRRHLGYEMPEYSDVVRPYYQKHLREWVEKALKLEWEPLPASLKLDKRGRYKVYQPQPLDRRLKRLASDMESKPKLDLAKRVKALDTARIEKRVGPLLRFSQALRLVPEDKAADYAGRDAANTKAIDAILDEKLRAQDLVSVADMDMAILPMLDRMQSNGIRCDIKHLRRIQKDAEATMVTIEHEVSKRWFGRRVNLKSHDQVAELLYKRLHLRAIRYTKKGRGSTDKKTLEMLKDQHEAVTKVRQYRIAEKNHSFAVMLPKFADSDGDVRGTIKYTRVVSGRTSMEKPNMQQIPTRTEEGREIRNGFVPRPGLIFGSWDYDQIEMKVMAHLSKDPRLLKYLNAGKDIHIKTAALIFGVKDADVSKVQRTVTKNINYGLLFMIQERGLHDQLRLVGIHEYSVADCANLISEWFRIYARVQDFREECIARARRRGYAASMWGRRRYLPALYWPIDHLRYEAERQAVSHEISSSAQDVIKRAMARLWPFLQKLWAKGRTFEPLLQLHDELLFELEPRCKKYAKTVSDIMCEDRSSFSVPITSSNAFGERWGECKG